MIPPDALPPTAEPPRDPAPEATARQLLAGLRPAEPPAEAKDRLWQRIAAHMDDPAAAALAALAPAEPPAEARSRAWRQVQAATAARRPRDAVGRPRRPAMGRAWRQAGFALALLFVALAVTVNSVAQAALPGSALYPVKLAWEDTHLALTLQPDARARLALDFGAARREEARRLVAQGGAPALVAQTVAAGLAWVQQAAAQLPPEDVASAIDDWQREAATWPAAYADPAAAISAFVSDHPDLGPAPTAAPTSPAAATTTAAPSHTAPASATRTPGASATPLPTLPATVPAGATSRPTALGPSETPGGGGAANPTNPPAPTLPALTLPAVTGSATPAGETPSATATVVGPTPTLPVSVEAPTLLAPTATHTPLPPGPTASPSPTRTPLVVLPTVTLPIPTLPIP